MMFEIGSQIDKYEVLSALGSGGMARVYKVRHALLGSLHAMKVLDPQLVEVPELRARFLAEGRIQAQLRHPNIVAVTDIIAQPGIAGLVADFIEGPTLESAIRNRRSPPTPDEVKAVFLPLLDGLHYAHEHGIVHRDIKPSNIVLDRGRPRQTVPRILDFGIAKITEAAASLGQTKGKTQTGTRMGTLHYMSPEQVLGQSDLDRRADVFSTAVTLFEFISGQLPFDADSDFSTMKQIVEGHPTPIRTFQADLDPILEACVSKGLARDRERRFQSCEEFAALLVKVGGAAAGPRSAGSAHQEIPEAAVALVAQSFPESSIFGGPMKKHDPLAEAASPAPIESNFDPKAFQSIRMVPHLMVPPRVLPRSSSEGTAGGATFRAAGLEWQKEPADRKMTWADAKSYCASLSLAGGRWRIPTKDELLELYHARKSTLAIAGDTRWYWSSTPHGNGNAWYVHFLDGFANYLVVTDSNNVRCVRDYEYRYRQPDDAPPTVARTPATLGARWPRLPDC